MKYFSLISLLIGITFLAPHKGEAFTFNNSAEAVFGKDDVSVNVSTVTCQNIGISNAELLDLAGEAIDRFWNTVPSSRLHLSRGELVTYSSLTRSTQLCSGSSSNSCTPSAVLSGIQNIVISCNDNTTDFSSIGILGISIPSNISGNRIDGAVVFINDRSGSYFATLNRDEKIAVIAHEIGHTLGLGHSPVPDALMYYKTVKERRYLGQDDIDGITYLYPKEENFVGCGSVKESSNNSWPLSMIVGFGVGLILLNFRRMPIRLKQSKR